MAPNPTPDDPLSESTELNTNTVGYAIGRIQEKVVALETSSLEIKGDIRKLLGGVIGLGLFGIGAVVGLYKYLSADIKALDISMKVETKSIGDDIQGLKDRLFELETTTESSLTRIEKTLDTISSSVDKSSKFEEPNLGEVFATSPVDEKSIITAEAEESASSPESVSLPGVTTETITYLAPGFMAGNASFITEPEDKAILLMQALIENNLSYELVHLDTKNNKENNHIFNMVKYAANFDLASMSELSLHKELPDGSRGIDRWPATTDADGKIKYYIYPLKLHPDTGFPLVVDTETGVFEYLDK